MNITEDDIVGELVAIDYKLASVFKAEGIDFCCRGNRSIAEVASMNKIKSVDLIKRLSAVMATTDQVYNYDSWPADLLADYIEKKHHRYVEERITEIKPYLAKIAKVHGEEHPELHEIQKHFLDSAGELTMHMKKEELVLFPFIRKMMKYKQDG